MSISRYSRTARLGLTSLGTPGSVHAIRAAIKAKALSTTTYVTSGNERLDTIAGKKYGNSRLWWLIAAASNIGWALQVPPGTRLLIPVNLNQVAGLIK
jgi:nucleoid-associated protein YgaU